MIRDAPPTALPDGAVWDAIDYLVDQPGIARKRGGTIYAGPVMSAANYAKLTAYCPEFATPLVGIGDNNTLYTISSGATTSQGNVGVDAKSLAYRVGGGKQQLIIVGTGAAPRIWNGSALTVMGGSAPIGCTQTCVYKTRLILANNSATPQRMFFSKTPNIEDTWNTVDSWQDADYPITGLASLQNAVIVFQKERVSRLTGTDPPPFGNLDLAPIADIGCSDNRSVCTWQNTVIFANPEGVFQTGGVGYSNLSKAGGMQSYWQGLFSGYNPATWSVAAFAANDMLFLSIIDNTGTLRDSFAVYLRTNAWTRLSNWKAMHYCSAPDIQSGLFYADRSAPRVVSASGAFFPQAINKTDANGVAVAPYIQTRLFQPSPSLNHYGFGWLHYDMRDAASDNPTLAVSQATGYETPSFAAVRESPLVETTDEQPTRVTLAKVSQAVGLRIQQSGPSSQTELYGISAQVRPLPPQQLS
jgi:hypothetical protein